MSFISGFRKGDNRTGPNLSSSYAAPSKSDLQYLQSRSSSEEKSGLVEIAYGDRQHDQPREYKKTWLELKNGELSLYEWTGFGNTALSRGPIIERISLDNVTSFRRPVLLGSTGANLSEFSLLISKPSSSQRGDDSIELSVDAEASITNRATTATNSLIRSSSIESSVPQPLSVNRAAVTLSSSRNTPLGATAEELSETEFRNLHVRVPAGTGASDWFFSFVTAVVVNVSSKREAPVASALTTWLRSQKPGYDGLAPTPVMTPNPSTLTSSSELYTTADLMIESKSAFKFPPRASLQDDDDDDDVLEKIKSTERGETLRQHRTDGSSTSSSPSPTFQLDRKKSDDGLFFGDLSDTKTVVTRPGLRAVKTFNSITTPSNTPISSNIATSSTPKYMPPHLRRQLSLNSALDVLAEVPAAIPSKPFVRHSYSSVGVGQGHGMHGIFSSQGPRLRMEDAHIAVPDLQCELEKNLGLYSTAAETDLSDIEGRFGEVLKYDAREFINGREIVSPSKLDLSLLAGSSLYAVFDGHGGVESSTYAQRHFVKVFCEKLRPLLLSMQDFSSTLSSSAKEDKVCEIIGKAITQAFSELDSSLLRFAEEGTWRSGTTALVVVPLKGGRLIVASLGDSRAVLARPSHHHSPEITCICKDNTDSSSKLVLSACMYSAEVVSNEHTPEVERSRIVAAGGWVSIETEISLFKLHSMDATDPFVSRRLRQGKTLESRISRLCGELGVSRSLGDADYKGKKLASYTGWSWPAERNVKDRFFSADLVLGSPDINVVRVVDGNGVKPSEDDNVPFIILACDGLWEVLSNDEAVCICAQYLKEHGFISTRDLHSVDNNRGEAPDSHVPVGAARRLAELALKLGTSDNLTVMIVLLQ